MSDCHQANLLLAGSYQSQEGFFLCKICGQRTSVYFLLEEFGICYPEGFLPEEIFIDTPEEAWK